jgi:hypothetical protein
MDLQPQPLEQELRVEHLKRQLGLLSREDLEDYAGQLMVLSSKLTYQARQMSIYIAEIELGLQPND